MSLIKFWSRLSRHVISSMSGIGLYKPRYIHTLVHVWSQFTEACVLQKVKKGRWGLDEVRKVRRAWWSPKLVIRATSILSCIPRGLNLGIPTFEHKPLLIGSLEFRAGPGIKSHTSFCFFDFTLVVGSKPTTRIYFGRKPSHHTLLAMLFYHQNSGMVMGSLFWC